MAGLFERFPDVDGLVNNAAGNFTSPTLDLSFGGFRAVVEISLYGTFNASQAFARQLVRRARPGVILNIVASYAWTGAPLVAHSAAAKAAMVAFTKSVAREWGPDDIRVNAMAPGFVPTESAVRRHPRLARGAGADARTDPPRPLRHHRGDRRRRRVPARGRLPICHRRRVRGRRRSLRRHRDARRHRRDRCHEQLRP